MKRKLVWTVVLAFAIGSCGSPGGGGDEEAVGEARLELNEDDDPGNHGADQPWVRCPNRIREVAADPLGPVIAHGFKEAPGYAPELLDPHQRAFLKKASLRVTTDGGPNSVLWEDLRLPKSHPERTDVAHWVAGAIVVAGHRLPADPFVASFFVTGEDDGAGNPLPRFRVWDLRFRFEGRAVSGAICTLAAPENAKSPTLLTCRLPAPRPTGSEPLSFEPFTISETDAEESARVAVDAPSARTTVSARYELDGDVARARFYVITWDGSQSWGVHMDGAGNVLGVHSTERSFKMNGWPIDYCGPRNKNRDCLGGYRAPPNPLEAPTGINPYDVGIGNTTHLDSLPVSVPGFPNIFGPHCGPSQRSLGFVVCTNDFTADAEPPPADRLRPQPGVGNDFTGLVFPFALVVDPTISDPVPLTLMGPDEVARRPGPTAPSTDNVKYRRSDISDLTIKQFAPSHWAELQAFYNVGQLFQRYRLMGHPRFCDLANDQIPIIDWCDPVQVCATVIGGCNSNDPALGQALRQDPHRLEITVHWRGPMNQNFGNNGQAGLNFMRMGDFLNPALNKPFGIEGASEGSVFAHEYQHHIFQSLATDLGFDPCPTGSAGETCGALDEGLADAFASLHTDHDILGRAFLATTDPAPCSDPNNYPFSPLPGLAVRFACNSTNFSNKDPGFQERGTILHAALYRFQRRMKDGGWGYALPGRYMYQAQKVLSETHDNEQVYLAQLLGILQASPSARRFRALAQVAFEEKGIFPFTGLPGLTADVCPPGNSAAVCRFVSMKSLAIAGPLNVDDSEPPPTFDVFAPRGPLYLANVIITLANNPSFFTGGGNVFIQHFEPAATKPVINNSPPGFFRWTVPTATWNTLKTNLKPDKNIYYRVQHAAWWLVAGMLALARRAARRRRA